MSNFSSVKHYNIKNGDVTLYQATNGTIVELDSQILYDTIRCEGNTPYDALNAVYMQILMLQGEIYRFYHMLCTDGCISNRDTAQKVYLRYRQLLNDVFAIKQQYAE